MKLFIQLTAWLLILGAVAIIMGTGYTTREYFMGQREFPQVFKYVTPVPQHAPPVASAKSPDEQLQLVLGNLASQITGSEATFRFLNIGSWLAFSIFSLFLSTRLSAIGIKMLFGSEKDAGK